MGFGQCLRIVTILALQLLPPGQAACLEAPVLHRRLHRAAGLGAVRAIREPAIAGKLVEVVEDRGDPLLGIG